MIVTDLKDNIVVF